MQNPFILELAQDEDFCDRMTELAELMDRARNGQKVLLYSPRRYGKSSLVTRMQKELANEGFLRRSVQTHRPHYGGVACSDKLNQCKKS